MRIRPLTPISETVDSSKKKIRPLRINETNISYYEWFKKLDPIDVFRFDFPHQMSIRLGINWLEEIYLYYVEDHLEFSAFQREESDPLKTIMLRPFFFNESQSTMAEIDRDADDVFFYIPKYFCEGFNVDDEVVYEMIDQKLVNGELEDRFVVCRHV